MTADIHAMVGAYVLDAVDDLERAAFQRHLRECDACRAEVDELRETAARLADGAWSVPPPGLRATVLGAIANTRQLSPAGSTVSAGPARDRRRTSRWQRLIAAAAVLVTAGATGTAVYAIQDHRVRQAQATAAAIRASETRMQGILASPDLRVREQTLSGGGRVTVAYSRLHDAGVIVLAADAPPNEGRVYQLWTVRSRQPVSEGALSPGQSSIVKVVDGLPSATDVDVTVEPAGGSTTPTLPMVADVKLI